MALLAMRLSFLPYGFKLQTTHFLWELSNLAKSTYTAVSLLRLTVSSSSSKSEPLSVKLDFDLKAISVFSLS